MTYPTNYPSMTLSNLIGRDTW